jgi:hypothetical protein
MKHESIAVLGVSIILLIYTIFAGAGVLLDWVALIFAVSPVLIIWMVWVVLKHGDYQGEEMEDDQEYGYVDKPHLGKQEL